MRSQRSLRRFVIHDGNAGRSFRVDLVLKSGDAGQLDDEVQPLKREEILQTVGDKEIQLPRIADAGCFGIVVKNSQDLHLEAGEAICVEKVQEIRASLSASHDGHVEGKIGLRSPPDLQGFIRGVGACVLAGLFHCRFTRAFLLYGA